MKIGEIKVIVSGCTEGIYLRWWYNGWHYFLFQNGYEIMMETEETGIMTSQFFSVISKIERSTRKTSEYSYRVTLQGITPENIAGFTGLLLAEKVEQWMPSGIISGITVDTTDYTVDTTLLTVGGGSVNMWYEVEITRGEHIIKEEGTNGYIFDFEIRRKELPQSSSVYQKTLKLFIGDTLCDMDDSEVVPINKQVNNIAEMQDRQTDFTAQFKIRKTRSMRALFELSGEVGANTLFPYQLQECKLISDNIEIITGGILILDRVDDQYYYVSIISGNIDFFKQIESLKLTDLELAETIHTWNVATMAATHSCTSPECCYVYPLCEPSEDGGIIVPPADTGDRVDLYGGWIWCFVKVQCIWNEIFANARYTVIGGEVLDSDVFTKLFLPITSRTVTKLHADNYLYSVYWYGFFNAGFNERIGFAGAMLIKGDIYFQQGYYYLPFNATYKILLTINATVLFTDPVLSVYLTLVYQGDMILISQSGDKRNYEFEFTGTAGQIMSVYTDARLYFYYSLTIIEIRQAEISYGSVVEPRLYLPDMTQIDFVKMICNVFGLVPAVNARDHEIRFWNYSELYENIAVARDWSAYLSERDDEVEFKFGDYARRNYLRYRESKDVSKDQGLGSMPIDDETLPEEKDIVQLNVSTCDEVRILTNIFPIDVSRIGFNKWDENASEYVSNETIDPRIVYVDFCRQVYSPPYEKTFGIRSAVAPGGETDIDTPKKASSLEVSFSSLLPYYSNISRILTKTNLRRAKFNLPVYEVAGLRHEIPVYLFQYKAYFYVNKILNFVPGQLCTVELIRL